MRIWIVVVSEDASHGWDMRLGRVPHARLSLFHSPSHLLSLITPAWVDTFLLIGYAWQNADGLRGDLFAWIKCHLWNMLLQSGPGDTNAHAQLNVLLLTHSHVQTDWLAHIKPENGKNT